MPQCSDKLHRMPEAKWGLLQGQRLRRISELKLAVLHAMEYADEPSAVRVG